MIYMNLNYTIARYEFIDKDRFLVAFNICDDHENGAYIETILQTSDISEKTKQEVCQLAYNNLKPKIEELKTKFAELQSSIIGYQFVPTE